MSEFSYHVYWTRQEDREIERNLNKLNNFNKKFSVLIPDKEYGDYETWINVIKYAVFKKYYNWTWWNSPTIFGNVYQVNPEYFNEYSTENKLSYKKYEVGKFRYIFKTQTVQFTPFHIPVNKSLPIIPINDNIHLNMIKSYGKGSPQLNKDIRMIESSKHQLKHSYNKTLGRLLNSNNELTQEDLENDIFKSNPVFEFIRNYKPLWNMYCSGIDAWWKYKSSGIAIDKSNGADKRKGTNSNATEYTGNVQYEWKNGYRNEKPRIRTTSDEGFYTLFVPHYINEYLGKNVNTRREYKIALFTYASIGYYSEALDQEGWYGKLYPRHRYKGEEGKRLRNEVKEWLKFNQK